MITTVTGDLKAVDATSEDDRPIQGGGCEHADPILHRAVAVRRAMCVALDLRLLSTLLKLI